MKELLKLALEALEALENVKRVRNAEGGTKYQPDLEDKAIIAIKEDLAQPEQEPGAWVTAEDVKLFGTGQGEGAFLFKKKGKWNVPLYTTPPAAQRTWIGLTPKEVAEIVIYPMNKTADLVRIIEDKLRSKNEH